MNSVNQINNHITILASSWKQPPSELLIPLAHVCFVADYMKIESFVKFKGTVLKDLYGAAGIAQISSQINALDGYKEALNETAEVTENEIMECLLSVSKKFYRNDPSQIEQVIGKKLVITSPVPPNSQPTNPQHSPQAPPQVPPQRANLPSHNHQAPVHPQSPATQSPPPIIQNNTQQAHLRQSVPPAQFARIYQQKAQIAKQQQYKSKIVFEKEPNLYHPIDLPIFSEPIWADLMKTVKESIQ
ncbi:hypothetical protein GPJ56_003216 [Histomonas meleagridis]|uniref:uncharacterized protein n=1 Tax=Histomonas meleagridis TaxID=135588 RepID=UPI00355AAE31|nr:hypothetical protein GPJ56_003216 [Histomonas meleagridis]KAH0803151.1 hypothetical protein GO595_004064 [Histomonas meleagridis]